jgi:hypothetical protein
MSPNMPRTLERLTLSLLAILTIVLLALGVVSFFAPLHYYVRMGENGLVRCLLYKEKCCVEHLQFAKARERDPETGLWGSETHDLFQKHYSHTTFKFENSSPSDAFRKQIPNDPLGQVIGVIAPFWAFLIIACAYPVARFVSLYRRERRRLKNNQCLRCGYDLTGNVSGCCPECGPGPIVSSFPTKVWGMSLALTALLVSTAFIWIGLRSPVFVRQHPITESLTSAAKKTANTIDPSVLKGDLDRFANMIVANAFHLDLEEENRIVITTCKLVDKAKNRFEIQGFLNRAPGRSDGLHHWEILVQADPPASYRAVFVQLDGVTKLDDR